MYLFPDGKGYFHFWGGIECHMKPYAATIQWDSALAFSFVLNPLNDNTVLLGSVFVVI